MSDIQTEMIMNSDSSNIVNDILQELNNTNKNNSNSMPIQLQMQDKAGPIPSQSSLGLNENAVINQYDNTEISNQMQLNRQMDPHMTLNPDVRLDMKNFDNMNKLDKQGGSIRSTKIVTRNFIMTTLRIIKNIVVLFFILLLFLSPIADKLSVKCLPVLFSSSASQIFKWLGLIVKALLISVIYHIIYIFI